VTTVTVSEPYYKSSEGAPGAKRYPSGTWGVPADQVSRIYGSSAGGFRYQAATGKTNTAAAVSKARDTANAVYIHQKARLERAGIKDADKWAEAYASEHIMKLQVVLLDNIIHIEILEYLKPKHQNPY